MKGQDKSRESLSSKITDLVALIDYLRRELRGRSPLTVYLLSMASQNLLEEADVGEVNPVNLGSHNGQVLIKPPRRNGGPST
jgi:hypothetical protein